ncbi:MAG TPA: pyridoxamine 5'-phosphate oxidase family protein [Acidimicrobiia bacterium]|jgi:nitroimidazol reductase NimA-like FMN-containing flavoprotein (pyridoxamine 5'-phosphate oxidase superfamily)|nr:pyridoxamine 5'-phosphate oxidase family protein [Acidimicrobiia bacterium]
MLIDEGLELLSEEQCIELLAAHHLGRVGVTVGGLPVILPVNYTWIDDAIVFRTSVGTKLHAATEHAVVAFEVDAHDESEHTGWSVLAVGRSARVGDASEIETYQQRSVKPWVESGRDEFVRVTPELLTGRRIAVA